MKLTEYNLKNWTKSKVKSTITVDKKRILLLSLDCSAPIDGSKNIVAIDSENNVLWIADLPTEVYDIYYDMWLENGILYGRSSNSHIAEIDPKTGKIIKKYMVK